ncbi:unnamed protein product [Leptidea sinapis]|uniref:Uncharacterized protein n=1 Tax=Leptidea sinapis TaxID=189913 RepID=A0A5E4QWR8_9NEOP|nr:unnamed protein product [Leptidea sinapis]
MLLFKLLSVVCLLAMSSRCLDEDYEELEYDDGVDFDNYQDDTETNIKGKLDTRVRRDPPAGSLLKTLNPEEIREVREVLKQLLQENIYNETHTFSNGSQSLEFSSTSDPGYETYLTIAAESAEILLGATTPQSTENVSLARPSRSTALTVLRQASSQNPTLSDVPLNTTGVNKSTTAYSPKYPLNVPALLDLIAYLAADYETNLTRKLNETLANMTLPTASCAVWRTRAFRGTHSAPTPSPGTSSRSCRSTPRHVRRSPDTGSTATRGTW